MCSRRFGEEIPDFDEDGEGKEEGVRNESLLEILEWMRNDEIGSDAQMEGPFGRRKITYCDYTASARAMNSIEDYIKTEVLPFYGNTHSSVTVTAEQTTLFMHEARQEIRAMTGAGDLDDVIFTGSGATCAVELLLHLMQIERENDLVVVHSCQEHHSNLLPWRKTAKECHEIREDSSGRLDVAHLIEVLTRINDLKDSRKIVGVFTACSNITGVLNDVQKVTSVLKQFNAISIWDYASAAPYVPISVNGNNPIDAVFFSGHKFPGGVSSPGVLIVKKTLIEAKHPKRIGGGTVFFVNQSNEWYLKEAEHREEGGTADAIGAVRLAMSAKLKRTIGENNIEQIEEFVVSKIIAKFRNCEEIVLLGPPTKTKRLAVFSFLVREKGTGLFFHHNFISALLNDLFGIQTRAGCMCAGPYAHKLLNIDEQLSERFLNAIRESSQLDRTHLRRHAEYSQQEFLRPGFTRISFPYFFSMSQIDHVLDALVFVARNAADFLHLYQMNCESGEWHHKNQRVFHGRKWLGFAKFTENGLINGEKKVKNAEEVVKSLQEMIKIAENLKVTKNEDISRMPDGRIAVEEGNKDLRWFVLPIEIAEIRAGRDVKVHKCPIQPVRYEEGRNDESEGNDVIPKIIEKLKIEEEKRSAEESDFICPLNPEQPIGKRGIEGDVGKDQKEEEEVKETEDWNRRVIVERREMSREEEDGLDWHVPPLEMYKKVTDVVHQMKMIKEGDKVLVCLSGGKDSLSLLHILRFYQQRCLKARSTSFQLGAITIDPGSSEYNPRPLIEYCKSLNIDYFYEEQDIIGAAKKVPGLRSICAFCSRMKRGRLAAAAQLHGWNVLAMGQHLDDLAESFFIAAFQNGNLSTMKAQYETKDGTLRVIRPLVFVREKALRHFAEEKKLPVVAENCPACFNQATERHRVKQLLAQQELVFPELFNSLRSALKPLLLVDSPHTSEMRSQAIANIVKENR